MGKISKGKRKQAKVKSKSLFVFIVRAFHAIAGTSKLTKASSANFSGQTYVHAIFVVQFWCRKNPAEIISGYLEDLLPNLATVHKANCSGV